VIIHGNDSTTRDKEMKENRNMAKIKTRNKQKQCQEKKGEKPAWRTIKMKDNGKGRKEETRRRGRLRRLDNYNGASEAAGPAGSRRMAIGKRRKDQEREAKARQRRGWQWSSFRPVFALF
jgi:hypothetical protein